MNEGWESRKDGHGAHWFGWWFDGCGLDGLVGLLLAGFGWKAMHINAFGFGWLVVAVLLDLRGVLFAHPAPFLYGLLCLQPGAGVRRLAGALFELPENGPGLPPI